MTEGLQEVTREVDVQYDTHESNPVFPGWVILSLQLLVGLSLLLMQGGASKIISLTTEADTQSCGGKPQALDSAEHLPIMHLKHDADRGYRQALHEMMLIGGTHSHYDLKPFSEGTRNPQPALEEGQSEPGSAVQSNTNSW